MFDLSDETCLKKGAIKLRQKNKRFTLISPLRDAGYNGNVYLPEPQRNAMGTSVHVGVSWTLIVCGSDRVSLCIYVTDLNVTTRA